MALNIVWIIFFLIGFVVALVKLFLPASLGGDLDIFSKIVDSLFDSSKTGFEISLGLAAVMSLWLGIMKIGERAGAINLFARATNPFFKHLFPGIPKGHPASGSIMMNFSANMLGLDNAATPLGLKAMEELQTLNPTKDTASDSQIMFLALNTAGLAIIPTSVMAIRQTVALEQHVSINTSDIFLPVLICTYVSFVSSMIMVSIFQKINLFKRSILLFVVGFAAVMFGMYAWVSRYHNQPELMSKYIGLFGALIIFSIIISFILMGLLRKVNVYDTFIEGAKEGFGVAVGLMPYLIGLLIAIGVFRVTGCMDYIIHLIEQGIRSVGINADFVPALPIGLIKPLTGTGARGIMIDVLRHYGVNSFAGRCAVIIQGGTETTFYILAVYFGSVGIKNTRYAVTVGLLTDLIGVVVAIILAYLFFH